MTKQSGFINIGFGNIVFINRIVAVIGPDSAPVKRMLQDAREQGRLIDATYGRKTRAVIVTDAGSYILSPVQPETIAARARELDNAVYANE